MMEFFATAPGADCNMRKKGKKHKRKFQTSTFLYSLVCLTYITNIQARIRKTVGTNVKCPLLAS